VGVGNGAAAPVATLTAACGSGITVLMSNLDGDQPVTFTVATPAGRHESVTVAADKIVRRSYPVTAGTRTPLTVSAPGMSTASKSLPASCKAVSTHVLGVKVVRKPVSSRPVVQAAAQLPFTGPRFPVGAAAALGAGLLMAGAALTRCSARTARWAAADRTS
jgi:hypothetical protein